MASDNRLPIPVLAFVEVASSMGGVEFSTLYLAQRLNRNAYQPLVICPAEGDLPNLLRQHDIRVVILPQPRLFATSLRWGGRYWPNPIAWLVNLCLFIGMAGRLAQCLKQQRVNLVCTKGLFAHFYGGVAAWLNRIPCVWHIQDLVSARAGGVYPAIMGLAGRLLARYCIVDGTPIADQLSPYIPTDRLIVILNGVDIESFSPVVDGTGVRNEWGVAGNEILIGSVARFTPWKGQHFLVEAFAAIAADVPLAKLVLVGAPVFDTDEYEKELRASVTQHGLDRKVIFAGYRMDLPEVLAALDLFVHSAIEKDTSPLAVVSAMAAGKTLVCTNVAGVAELFPGGNEAVLVPVADSVALAQVLRELLLSPERRTALGLAARHHAESTLSLDHFADDCKKVFDWALE